MTLLYIRYIVLGIAVRQYPRSSARKLDHYKLKFKNRPRNMYSSSNEYTKTG